MTVQRLLCFIVSILLISCISLNRSKNVLKRDTWTGRFTTMYYTLNKNKPNSVSLKQPSKRELGLLQTDLNYIVSQIRKRENTFLTKYQEGILPSIKVIIKRDDVPNMSASCKEGVVYITTGLVKSVFNKSFNYFFSSDKLMRFSTFMDKNKNFNVDSNLYVFLNILNNARIKKVNFLSIFNDDDSPFDNMDILADLQQTISFTDNELVKVLAFLISHEFYHLLTECKISSVLEIEADIFGIIQYTRIGGSPVFEDMFTDVTGRPVKDIFFSLFSDSTIRENNGLYLSINERVAKIDSITTLVGEKHLEQWLQQIEKSPTIKQ